MTTPPPAAVDDLVLTHRFGVFFLGGALPKSLDLRFQQVSGLGATVETSVADEGGQNLYRQQNNLKAPGFLQRAEFARIEDESLDIAAKLLEVYYNSRGEAYKRVYLDKSGKVISQE